MFLYLQFSKFSCADHKNCFCARRQSRTFQPLQPLWGRFRKCIFFGGSQVWRSINCHCRYLQGNLRPSAIVIHHLWCQSWSQWQCLRWHVKDEEECRSLTHNVGYIQEGGDRPCGEVGGQGYRGTGLGEGITDRVRWVSDQDPYGPPPPLHHISHKRGIIKQCSQHFGVVHNLRLIQNIPVITMYVVTLYREIWSAQTLPYYLNTWGVPYDWINARNILVVKL